LKFSLSIKSARLPEMVQIFTPRSSKSGNKKWHKLLLRHKLIAKIMNIKNVEMRGNITMDGVESIIRKFSRKKVQEKIIRRKEKFRLTCSELLNVIMAQFYLK
jgi:hypothetical protein